MLNEKDIQDYKSMEQESRLSDFSEFLVVFPQVSKIGASSSLHQNPSYYSQEKYLIYQGQNPASMCNINCSSNMLLECLP
jgi:hypothetical protein